MKVRLDWPGHGVRGSRRGGGTRGARGRKVRSGWGRVTLRRIRYELALGQTSASWHPRRLAPAQGKGKGRPGHRRNLPSLICPVISPTPSEGTEGRGGREFLSQAASTGGDLRALAARQAMTSNILTCSLEHWVCAWRFGV